MLPRTCDKTTGEVFETRNMERAERDNGRTFKARLKLVRNFVASSRNQCRSGVGAGRVYRYILEVAEPAKRIQEPEPTVP